MSDPRITPASEPAERPGPPQRAFGRRKVAAFFLFVLIVNVGWLGAIAWGLIWVIRHIVS